MGLGLVMADFPSSPDSGPLLPCPFCGATPHRGLTKASPDQLHGDLVRRYRIWCPHDCAKVDCVNEEAATERWNTRIAQKSLHCFDCGRPTICPDCDGKQTAEVAPTPDLQKHNPFRAALIEACARFADGLMVQDGRTAEWHEAARSIPSEIRALAQGPDTSTDWTTDSVAQLNTDRASDHPDEGRRDAGSNPVAVATVAVSSPVGWGGHLPGKIEP